MTEGAKLVAQKLANGEEIFVDLFGGRYTQVRNAINVDIIAESGIRALASDLPKIFPPSSVSEIIASGLQYPFLEEAALVLKVGGRIYINASKGNPYSKVPDRETRKKLGSGALEQLKLQIVQEPELLDPRFANQVFCRSNGSTIPIESVKTTILEKLE